MVNRPLSSRDLELLSAYLDRQLSSTEQRRLEERMRLNPGLQNTLEELKRTRAIVRSLPKVRAPRNFTLTPAMVPARRPGLLWGLPLNWSAASALATLFLMVFFVSDFLGLFSPTATMQTAERPSDALALETAMNKIDQQSKAATEAPLEPALAMPVAPENARGLGGGGGGGEGSATLQPNQMVLGTPQPSADQQIVLNTPTPAAVTMQQPLVGIAPTATLTSTLTVPAATAAGTEMAFAAPTELAGASAESQPETAAPTTVLFTPWWVRLIETALLLVALGAGVFALSRRHR